jgi:hypothetical protein
METDFRITGDTLIEEIVEKAPALIRPLREYGIVCVRCGEPIWGTIEQVARDKGIDSVDEILREMNRILEENEASS